MLLLLLLSRFSCIQLCATSQTAAHQALPSMGLSRQEHWSVVPLPSPKTGNRYVLIHSYLKCQWTKHSDQKRQSGDIPDGPVVKILCFQCRGARVTSLVGELRSPAKAIWCSQKAKTILKSHRVADWIIKQKPTKVLLARDPLHSEGQIQIENEGIEKVISCKSENLNHFAVHLKLTHCKSTVL